MLNAKGWKRVTNESIRDHLNSFDSSKKRVDTLDSHDASLPTCKVKPIRNLQMLLRRTFGQRQGIRLFQLLDASCRSKMTSDLRIR